MISHFYYIYFLFVIKQLHAFLFGFHYVFFYEFLTETLPTFLSSNGGFDLTSDRLFYSYVLFSTSTFQLFIIDQCFGQERFFYRYCYEYLFLGFPNISRGNLELNLLLLSFKVSIISNVQQLNCSYQYKTYVHLQYYLLFIKNKDVFLLLVGILQFNRQLFRCRTILLIISLFQRCLSMGKHFGINCRPCNHLWHRNTLSFRLF